MLFAHSNSHKNRVYKYDGAESSVAKVVKKYFYEICEEFRGKERN